MTKELTQELLKKELSYNPETGEFLWKRDRRGRKTKEVGWADPQNGRIKIGIDRKGYWAGRLAFLYMLGRWPKGEVDHINRDPTDNRWANLREVSHSKNQINADLYKNNTTGHKNIYRTPWGYMVKLNRDKKQIYLGVYKTLDKALETRDLYLAI